MTDYAGDKPTGTLLLLSLSMLSLFLVGCMQQAPNNSANTNVMIKVVPHQAQQRVDVLVNDQPLTSYLYTDTLAVLKKPVLYPINTANDVPITRGYSLNSRPGDRTDHPHHIGHWFNYGVVNGLDFWGNSNSAYAKKNSVRMGTIRHRKITEVKSGNEKGVLGVTMDWLTPDKKMLLREETRFIFRASPKMRVIDRITTLTAQNDSVHFTDSKEGMMAVRVRRELEHPSDDPVTVIGSDGKPTDQPVLNNENVTGEYLTSEGIRGTAAWGKRAKWVRLAGTVEGDSISVAILDHPKNVGYPTYWHARGYGLFSANPLGQKVFSEGKEELNLSLAPGTSATFRYRMIVYSGQLSSEQLNKQQQQFSDTVD